MGRLGYLSAAQDALAVSYNDLPSYAASLEKAMTGTFAAWATGAAARTSSGRRTVRGLPPRR